MSKLDISIDKGYRVLTFNNKQVRFKIAPVVKRYTKLLEFNKEEGLVYLEYEAKLLTGETVFEDDTVDLNEELWVISSSPKKLINSIESITINKEKFRYDPSSL
ncbi:MAG: hypothetical protein IJ593_10685 [Lachnospiraceae bacterium]|nr:hypothetical protein [Lachnospiraceae bacterium]